MEIWKPDSLWIFQSISFSLLCLLSREGMKEAVVCCLGRDRRGNILLTLNELLNLEGMKSGRSYVFPPLHYLLSCEGMEEAAQINESLYIYIRCV